MKGMWSRVAIVVAALVAVNLLARLGVRLAGPDDSTEFVIGLWSIGAMMVVLAVAVFLWARSYLVPRVLTFAGTAIGVSALLVTLLGPFVSGGSPFENGINAFLFQILVCMLVLSVGGAIGLLTAMALGLDPTSRAWKRQAERVKSKPRR